MICFRSEFVRNDLKRGTYRISKSAHLNRPTVEPNRIWKQPGLMSVQQEETVDLNSTTEWAVRRTSTQVLQVGKDLDIQFHSVVSLVFCHTKKPVTVVEHRYSTQPCFCM